MRFSNLTLFLLVATTLTLGNTPIKEGVLNDALVTYVNALKPDFSKIPADRKVQLNKITAFIQQQINAGEPVQLTYICTHNSRRSHFGQVWAAAAAVYYDIPQVKTFSGGTEVSAFNQRAAAACSRAGFVVKKVSEGPNARYEVSYASDTEPINAFSKKYNDAVNPQRDFCAVMTCSQAD